MTMLDDVLEFHHKFGMPVRQPGQVFQKDVVLFRLTFLLEELQELSSALNNNDFDKATDALIDLVWVALGTGDIFSLPVGAAWPTVKAANMAKEKVASSAESKRGSLLDIGKPRGWRPPNIRQHLDPADLTVQLALHPEKEQ